MSRGRGSDKITEPDSVANTEPVELYPTTDIRWVLTAIGRLEAKVDRLITGVHAQGQAIEDFKLKDAKSRGAYRAYAAVGGVVIFLVAVATLVVAFLAWRNPQPALLPPAAQVVPLTQPVPPTPPASTPPRSN